MTTHTHRNAHADRPGGRRHLRPVLGAAAAGILAFSIIGGAAFAEDAPPTDATATTVGEATPTPAEAPAADPATTTDPVPIADPAPTDGGATSQP